jgi:hypothetical protein
MESESQTCRSSAVNNVADCNTMSQKTLDDEKRHDCGKNILVCFRRYKPQRKNVEVTVKENKVFQQN